MPVFAIVLIVIAAVTAGVLIFLSVLGKRLEKRQAEQDEKIRVSSQTVSMLIIDKKKMHMKDSGLPEQVLSSTPWYARRAKLPIVKAKVGSKVMSFIADTRIYEDIPVKKEVKATISGLYITSVRGLHGKLQTTKRKKTLRERLLDKATEYRAKAAGSSAPAKKKKK